MALLTTASAAERRYLWRTLLAMLIFALSVVFLARVDAVGITALVYSALLSLPIIVVAYEFQYYVRRLDEMQSGLEMQAAAVGFGSTLVILTVWSLAAGFGVLPEVEPAFALPIGVVLHGAVRFIQNRRLDEE